MAHCQFLEDLPAREFAERREGGLKLFGSYDRVAREVSAAHYLNASMFPGY